MLNGAGHGPPSVPTQQAVPVPTDKGTGTNPPPEGYDMTTTTARHAHRRPTGRIARSLAVILPVGSYRIDTDDQPGWLNNPHGSETPVDGVTEITTATDTQAANLAMRFLTVFAGTPTQSGPYYTGVNGGQLVVIKAAGVNAYGATRHLDRACGTCGQRGPADELGDRYPCGELAGALVCTGCVNDHAHRCKWCFLTGTTDPDL